MTPPPGNDPAHDSRRDPLARERNSITIYGRRSVTEALDAPDVKVLGVRVAREVPGEFRERLSRRCREQDVPFETLTLRDVGAFTGDPRNDQGVAARVRLNNAVEVEEFLPTVKGQGSRAPAHLLALDRVTNPQNVGMIVRSTVAAGMRGVLWPTAGSPWVDALIVKSSAGTVYRCPIVRCHLLTEGLHELKRNGFKLVGLDMGAPGSLFEFTPAHRTVVIVGGETTGLSPEVSELLDDRVSIPMAAGVESLNAAVAASLVCFEFARRKPTL